MANYVAWRGKHLSSTPAAPPAGTSLLYFKTDGNLYKRDSSGETVFGGAPVTPTMQQVVAASSYDTEGYPFSIPWLDDGNAWTISPLTFDLIYHLTTNSGTDDQKIVRASDPRLLNASQRQLPTNGGSTSWIRLATINGGSASGGASIVLMCAGQGNYGAATRAYDIVSLGQRGDNGYSFSGTRMGPSSTPWVYSVKQISTYVFELWAKRWVYDSPVTVTVLHSWNGTLNLDSQTTTLPTGLTALELSSSPDLSRAVNVYNGSWPTRPAAKYVEWMGPTAPGAGLMQANDVFTDTSS